MKLVTLGGHFTQINRGKLTTSGDDIPPVTLLGPWVFFKLDPFIWGDVMIVYAIKLMLNGKNCLMVRIKNLLLTTRTQKQYLDQASQLFGLFLKKVRIFLFGNDRFFCIP